MRVNNFNTSAIFPQSDTLFRVSIRKAAEIAIAQKPVFGANVTLFPPSLNETNFVAAPNRLLGWLDHNRLDHLVIKPTTVKPRDTVDTNTLKTRYFFADDGTLRTTQPLRVHLLGSSADEIHRHGWMLFSPM